MVDLIGESPAVATLRAQVARLLERRTPVGRLPAVFISGETGVGKGLLAKLLHRHGPRAEGPFVPVNCAAIPETLVEAELFGFERGAFTDARQPKPGLFHAAHRGILFLDEVGALPSAAQAKLLTALEERQIRRLGSTRSEDVDVWVLSATNDDLDAAVAAGRFRADLYHRLTPVVLRVPPLRERGHDILRLADHFLARACADYGLPPRTLDPGARAALMAQPWPGNVRELINLMERAALLTDAEELTSAHLNELSGRQLTSHHGHDPPHSHRPPPNIAFRASDLGSDRPSTTLSDLAAALNATGWNLSRAAQQLGIPRNTLRYRMQKLGLEPAAPGATTLPVSDNDLRSAKAGEPTATEDQTLLTDQLRWDRRWVSVLKVLFTSADALGSYHSAPLLREIMEKVLHFGGQVQDLGPHTLTAVFGAEPMEDAPTRAVNAALVLRKMLERTAATGARLRAVFGVHVGEALIGRGGPLIGIHPADRDVLWATAERLVAEAPPDTIAVSPSAVAVLDRRFALKPLSTGLLGSAQVIGNSHTRFAVGGHPASQLVGRDRELAILEELYAQAAVGKGQVVGLVGEPGVGKSRLAYEFTRASSARQCLLLQGGAVSHGQTTPYLPIVDLMKGYFRIDPRDDARRIQDRIAERVLALDHTLEPILESLWSLFDVVPRDAPWHGLEPRQRQANTRDAFRRVLLTESQLQPLLLVLEDLHWLDSATETLLNHLVEGLPAARIFLLVTYRPEFHHTWSSKTYYAHVRIDPLSPERAAVLLAELVGSDPSLIPFTPILIESTGGNPFFLEEAVKTLAEAGTLAGTFGGYTLAGRVSTIQVPASVQAVLTARIDRLPQLARDVLQASSVIGRQAPRALVHAIAGISDDSLRRGLGHLVAAEFLYEIQQSSGLEYRFKHAITQEVAYSSLPSERQYQLHARVVDAMEQLYPDRLFEHAQQLGQHAFRGKQWAKALAYLRQAGHSSYGRGTLAAAREAYQQALDIVTPLPPTPEHLRLAIDLRLDMFLPLAGIGEPSRGRALLEEAAGIAHTLGDDLRLGHISVRLGSLCWMQAEYDLAAGHGENGLRIAEHTANPELRLRASHVLGQAWYARGDYRLATDLLLRTVEGDHTALAQERLGFTISPYAFASGFVAWSLATLGEFDRALQYSSRGVAVADGSGHERSRGVARVFHATTLVVRGHLTEALPIMQLALDICQRDGVVFWQAFALGIWGWLLAALGRAEEGATSLAKGAGLYERAGIRGLLAFFWARWADALVEAGEHREAERVVTRALSLAEAVGERGSEAEALRVQATLFMRTRNLEAARACYERALARAEHCDMRPLMAHCHFGLGKVCLSMDGREQVNRHLTTAAMMYREMDMRFWLDKAGTATTDLP